MAAQQLTAEVDVHEDDGSELTVSGEIYRRGADAKTGPLVTHVIASPMRSSRFLLDAGDYELRFHVERAGGTFTLSVRSTDNATNEAAEFDTALGYEHRVFAFTVR